MSPAKAVAGIRAKIARKIGEIRERPVISLSRILLAAASGAVAFIWRWLLTSGVLCIGILYCVPADGIPNIESLRGLALFSGFVAQFAWTCFATATRLALGGSDGIGEDDGRGTGKDVRDDAPGGNPKNS